MARDGIFTVRDAEIEARSKPNAVSMATVSGQIALEVDETGPHRIEIVGPGKVMSAECLEIAENSRAIRRGKAASRRMLLVEPLTVDLAEGPVTVVLRSGESAPRVLAHLDLPGSGIARFRHLLQFELEQDLARRLTYRRTARLERSFAKLPESPNSAEWVESWIILNSVRRIRPSKTHSYIGQLRQLRDDQGCPERFTQFLTSMVDIHGAELPNSHDYGASLDQHDRAALWQGISDIMEMLKGLGLTAFLNSGTLLGAVREGDLLGHDDDIDLAVLISGRTQEEAAQSWLDLRLQLDGMGLISDRNNRSGTSIIRACCAQSV